MSDNTPVVKETTQETNTQVESKPERPEADIKATGIIMRASSRMLTQASSMSFFLSAP